MHSMLRLIHPETGPIVSVESVPQPHWWWPRCWRSQAQLAQHFDASLLGRATLSRYGTGWHRDKGASQTAAVGAALRRAVVVQGERGALADWGAGAYGLAASSQGADDARIRAHLEAATRWSWMRVAAGASMTPIDRRTVQTRPLWARHTGTWQLFKAEVTVPWVGVAHVVLSVLRLRRGGLVAGASCAVSQSVAVEQAALATWASVCRVDALCTGDALLINGTSDQRLWSHATDADLAARRLLQLRGAASAAVREWDFASAVVGERMVPGPWQPEWRVCRVDFAATDPDDDVDTLNLWSDYDAF